MAFDVPDEVTIDTEFRDLIPPLSDEEFERLKNKILSEGCTETLKFWAVDGADILIDGHNRYSICQQYGIPFEREYIRNLNNRDDVVVWMVNNQLARRNISDFAKAELVLKEKDAVARIKKQNSISNLKYVKTSMGEISPIDKQQERTSEILAKKAGVSKDTIKKTDKILKEASQEVIDKARKGEISLNKAYQSIKQADSQKQEPEQADVPVEEDAPSAEELVDELSKENDILIDKIQSLTKDDKDAEIVRLTDLIANLEQRLAVVSEQAHQKDKQLRWNANTFKELRKILGVEMNTQIVQAVRKLKGI